MLLSLLMQLVALTMLVLLAQLVALTMLAMLLLLLLLLLLPGSAQLVFLLLLRCLERSLVGLYSITTAGHLSCMTICQKCS
jgi:hypothetical protein